MKKIILPKPEQKKEFRFFHQNNKDFTGFLLKETDDFYTIELTSGVAGLNGIWNAGEKVTWSKEFTSIVAKQKISRKRRRKTQGPPS